MALRRVVFGVTGALLASTAVLAQQGVIAPEPRVAQQAVQPYIPPDGRISGQPQSFYPQDFRANRAQPAVVAGTDARTNWAEHRGQADPNVAVRTRVGAQDSRPVATAAGPVDYRAASPRVSTQPPPAYLPNDSQQIPAFTPPAIPAGTIVERPYVQPAAVRAPVQDSRPQETIRPARPVPGVLPVAAPAAVDTRLPVYEARPGVIDPRVVIPREEKYIDYKPIDGRPYDFRPIDYKPVDTRSLEYRSFDNKIQDQKVLDPRLKDKGPEIQTRLECKAILYRAVECNFLDYKEVDPKLQDLFAKYPEVTLGVVPKEYSKETMDRWAPLMAHLSREIGLKISLKIANDYQALMESQRAGLIHIAVYSPMAYARARHTGAKIEAFAVETNGDGSRGSYSVLYTLARGAAPKTEDFKGKSLGLVDPNSISGYSVPRFALASQKLDPDQVLNRQVFTGSHENALIALSQGLVDYAVGQWTSDEDSTLARLLARGALKNVDGSSMRRDDFRVVMKSEMIINSPVAYLSELPDDLKATIRRAVLEAPMRDRAAFDRIYDGKGRNWESIDASAYDNTVELIRYIDDGRRAQATATKQAAR